MVCNSNALWSASEAEAHINQLAQPLDPQRDRELLPLTQSLGRVLADTVTSPLDFPHWDNSAMDGYAVRFADVQQCSADRPITLAVVTEIPAGKIPQVSIKAGQAARIFTGAMVPLGADTIVMQEDTEREGDRVILRQAPQPQAFVRHRGSFQRSGEPLLPAGIQLQAADLAILAAAQCTQVPVYRWLRVAIFATGDELVPPDRPLQPGQIVDSNSYALAALVQQGGALAQVFGIVPDSRADLRRAIISAQESADVILSSGGVSVGDYDYIDELLQDLGATLHIRSVAVKPGKPLTVATLPGVGDDRPRLYFGLPGNPVSSLVTFWRFVQPALQRLSGRRDAGCRWLTVPTAEDLHSGGGRETYVWGRVTWPQGGNGEEIQFNPAPGYQNSANLVNLAQTNALAQVPLGVKRIGAGDRVKVLLV
ncbi:molybdopterin molybdotransferase MoeA [Prochlorothrix hollandica]|uniref:Molybdopterin molybdenumtransferase n=1 Tax=Prochlorothrix hollandica PCC 9006 = CALU 1027 TaxID=317619 RepID=A0A0M2PXQ7_PROHO|nr:gephyrin-like molybdotransferase Glp [Prochlorothrix hollandica]KKJ01226.1 molybdopterin molybdenumtransferase [Prochlorothrix hollandica PCC 9006 = CALU 1027]